MLRSSAIAAALCALCGCRPPMSIELGDDLALLGFDGPPSACALRWTTGTLEASDFPVNTPTELELYAVRLEDPARALRLAGGAETPLAVLESRRLVVRGDELVIDEAPAVGVQLPRLAEGDFEPRCDVCGDQKIDFTESCDDGNLEPGDGCDARCATEPSFEVRAKLGANEILCHGCEERFVVLRAELEGGPLTPVGTSTDGLYRDDGVEAGRTYSYYPTIGGKTLAQLSVTSRAYYRVAFGVGRGFDIFRVDPLASDSAELEQSKRDAVRQVWNLSWPNGPLLVYTTSLANRAFVYDTRPQRVEQELLGAAAPGLDTPWLSPDGAAVLVGGSPCLFPIAGPPRCDMPPSRSARWRPAHPGEYVRAHEGRLHLEVLDGASTPIGDLLTSPDFAAEYYRWSPGGNYLGLTGPDGAAVVVRTSTAISAPAPLFEPGASPVYAWSPDETRIAFADASGVYVEPFRFGAPTRASTKLSDSRPGSTLLEWTPDGRYLVIGWLTPVAFNTPYRFSLDVCAPEGPCRRQLEAEDGATDRGLDPVPLRSLEGIMVVHR